MPQTNITSRRALVGFFDVLGYQTFLNNNTEIEAVEPVFDLLNNIQERVRPAFNSFNEVILNSLNSLEYLIFSDSILIHMPFAEDDEDGFIRVFLAVCSVLSRRMFDAGLPVRGAVSTGLVYISGYCFAGSPIVEAYRSANDLNIAAVAVCPSLEERCARMRDNGDLQRRLIQYQIPFKSGDKGGFLVNFVSLRIPDRIPLDENPEESVANSFTAHRKILPPSDPGKLRNTVDFIKFVLKMDERRDFGLVPVVD